jgi:hypothetical protein
MVNPDVSGLLDRDGIAVIRLNLGDLHVADNDVLLSIDSQTNTGEGYVRLLALLRFNVVMNLQLPVFPMMDLFEVT